MRVRVPAGLTLVRANHVFLLEPAMDPAVEAQAVSRVHRIGQARRVIVTRLVVDATVEVHILALLHHHSHNHARVEEARDAHGGEEEEQAGTSLPGPSCRRERVRSDDWQALLDVI